MHLYCDVELERVTNVQYRYRAIVHLDFLDTEL